MKKQRESSCQKQIAGEVVLFGVLGTLKYYEKCCVGGLERHHLLKRFFFLGVWSPQPCEERVSPKLVVGLMVAIVWWAGR